MYDFQQQQDVGKTKPNKPSTSKCGKRNLRKFEICACITTTVLVLIAIIWVAKSWGNADKNGY